MKTWLDTKAAAEHCNCSAKTIHRAVAAGQLRAVRLGGNLRVRFKSGWLDSWMEAGASDQPSGNRGALTTGIQADSNGLPNGVGDNVKRV